MPDSLANVGPPDGCRLCVSIDFGTSGTGYAFAPISKSAASNSSAPAVQAPNVWPGQVTDGKTRTCLLLDENNEFLAFGQKAFDQYMNASEDEQIAWRYFRKFKMSLYGNTGSEDREVVAANGKKTMASVVFTRALQAVSEYALECINASQAHNPYKKSQVYWVLTVPAIWSEGAKAFMLRVAAAADMTDGNPKNICLAREPEAASLHCRMRYQEFAEFPVGVRWAVMDCGGGTIDAVVHELRADGVKEINQPASGDNRGSTAINGIIMQLLKEVVGAGNLEIYQGEDRRGWLDLLENIETAKKQVSPPKPGREAHSRHPLFLPDSFISSLKTRAQTNLPALAAAFNAANPQWRDAVVADGRSLRFSFACMHAKVFEQHLEWIIQRMRTNVRKTPGVKYVFLVGNFATCDILYRDMQKAAQELGVTLIRPEQAGLSIAIGAVLLGLAPRLIASRVAPLSYGVSVSIPYTEKHEADRRPAYYVDGVKRTDAFSVFIKKDQHIPADHIVEHVFHPTSDNTTKVPIKLLQSGLVDTPYPDSETCFQCSEMTLDLKVNSKQMGHMKRNIIIRMQFGGAQITASAKDEFMGEEREVTMQYFGRPTN